MTVARTADEINRKVELDFNQRARAVRLEDVVSEDEYATAAEIIYLRDLNAALLKALEDLSFECDGVTRVVAPSRETYNRTFAVLRKIRDGVTIEVPK